MNSFKLTKRKSAAGNFAGWFLLFSVLVFGTSANAGDLVNTARSLGTDPAGAVIPSVPDSVSVPVIAAAPNLSVLKTVTANDENGDGHGQIGETLSYSFTIKNTGNVTLTNIKLFDPLTVPVSGTIATLAPGISDPTTFSFIHTITGADVAAGSRSNQAQATATSITAGSTVDGVTDLSHPSDENADAPTLITFTDAPIDAVADTPAAVNGFVGGSTVSVLGNDTLNSLLVNPVDVTLTAGTAPTPTLGSITMNGDGTITVAPGTSAGSYAYPYTVCEVLNPANCDTATATVLVSAPTIDAVADTPVAVNGFVGGSTVSVLGNDTLNSLLVNPVDVTLTDRNRADPDAGFDHHEWRRHDHGGSGHQRRKLCLSLYDLRSAEPGQL